MYVWSLPPLSVLSGTPGHTLPNLSFESTPKLLLQAVFPACLAPRPWKVHPCALAQHTPCSAQAGATRGHLALVDMSWLSRLAWSCSGIRWAGARDTAEQPTARGSAPQPRTVQPQMSVGSHHSAPPPSALPAPRQSPSLP